MHENVRAGTKQDLIRICLTKLPETNYTECNGKIQGWVSPRYEEERKAEVQLKFFLTSTLDGETWLASRSGRLIPKK
jgi:hypothetical protein